MEYVIPFVWLPLSASVISKIGGEVAASGDSLLRLSVIYDVTKNRYISFYKAFFLVLFDECSEFGVVQDFNHIHVNFAYVPTIKNGGNFF